MKKQVLQGHAVLAVTIVILTVSVTAGYGVACSSISDKLAGELDGKLRQAGQLRGETVDSR